MVYLRKKNLSLIILSSIILSCRFNSNSEEKTNENLEMKAYDAFNSGDFLFSIHCYDKLIEKDSLIGRYYYGRAYSYSGLVRFEEAAKDFLKSVELNYRKADSYNKIGGCYAYVKDSLALIYFRKAYEINPGDSDNQLDYNKCLKRLNDTANKTKYQQ